MTNSVTTRANLVGKTSSEIAALVADHVDHRYRGQQVAGWIIDRNARGFEEMSNLPKELRRSLTSAFIVGEPDVLEVVRSVDGSSKYLFGLADGLSVEGVIM